MTDKEQLFFFCFTAIWAIVWIIIVAILKARQPKWEKGICLYPDGMPYLSDTDFWIGLSIWWPVLLILSPFYLLYKAVYKLAEPKNK